MARTQVTGLQVLDGSIGRPDLITNITGTAVITKLVAGTGVTITSTGIDAGTGDVTINFSGASAVTSVFGRTGAVVKAVGDYNFTDLAGSLAATQAPAFTGDATSVAGAVALTLATVNANVGTFNTLTVNAKGLVTAASNVAGAVASVFGRTGAVVKAVGDYNFTDLAGTLAATQAPALTGDVTTVAGAVATTLATVNANIGVFNSVTVNAKGLVTAATNVTAPVTSVFGRTGAVVKAVGDYNFTDLAGSLSAAQHPALTGDATSVAGALALTLATVNANVGTFNSVTVNAKGLVTAASNVVSAVTSIFGRTGAVVKAVGDYNFTDLAGSLAAAQAPAYTGDATSVAGAVALTLATLAGLVAGTYNSVTINVKGQVTAATTVAAPVTSVFGRTGAVVKAVGDYNFTDLAGSLLAAQHPALTGDATSVAGALALTLATVNASVGVFNSVTVNAKGLVTAASNVASAVTSVFGRSGAVVKAVGDYNFTDIAGSLAAAQHPAHTGDATSVAGALALTLATVNASPGTFNSVTVNAKGLVTAGTSFNNAGTVTLYNTAGAFTWVKPIGVTSITVIVQGGGGGGGSGQTGLSSVTRAGGGGGSAGGKSIFSFQQSAVSNNVNLTVGPGGAGGNSTTVASTSGVTGGNGGASQFGSVILAFGGGGGPGGVTAGSPGSAGGAGLTSSGGAGGVSASSGGAGLSGGQANFGQGGGGSGGGIATTVTSGGGGGGLTAIFAGLGASSSGGVVAGPTAGGAAGTFVDGSAPGGGGGASSTAAGTAGAGGAGSGGSGGGGGGAGTDGSTNSGPGGAGGAGYVMIITYF